MRPKRKKDWRIRSRASFLAAQNGAFPTARGSAGTLLDVGWEHA